MHGKVMMPWSVPDSMLWYWDSRRPVTRSLRQAMPAHCDAFDALQAFPIQAWGGWAKNTCTIEHPSY